MITEASRLLERLTDRVLKQRLITTRLTGPMGPKLYARAAPIEVDTTVAPAPVITIDGVVQTVWKTEADGDPATFNVVVASDNEDEVNGLRNHFWRGSYWQPVSCSPGAVGRNILATYTGGFKRVPEDLKRACKYLLQKQWRDQSAQSAGFRLATNPIAGEIVPVNEPAIPFEVRIVIDQYRRMGL